MIPFFRLERLDGTYRRYEQLPTYVLGALPDMGAEHGYGQIMKALFRASTGRLQDRCVI